jgi:hypothetical protein
MQILLDAAILGQTAFTLSLPVGIAINLIAVKQDELS